MRRPHPPCARSRASLREAEHVRRRPAEIVRELSWNRIHFEEQQILERKSSPAKAHWERGREDVYRLVLNGPGEPFSRPLPTPAPTHGVLVEDPFDLLGAR